MLARPSVRQVVDALVAVAFVWAIWALPDRLFTWFVTEDGLLEWLQVVALAVVLVVSVRRARLDRSLVWAGAAAVMIAAIGEEMAWGSRLIHLAIPSVQDANVQGDLTIHNIGGMRGLSKTFGALALIGFAGAFAVVRRRPGLAVWFALPAAYAFVRVVDNDPITSRFAKLSEILELVLYVAMARVAVALRARRPTGAGGAPPSRASGRVERPLGSLSPPRS